MIYFYIYIFMVIFTYYSSALWCKYVLKYNYDEFIEENQQGFIIPIALFFPLSLPIILFTFIVKIILKLIFKRK